MAKNNVDNFIYVCAFCDKIIYSSHFVEHTNMCGNILTSKKLSLKKPIINDALSLNLLGDYQMLHKVQIDAINYCNKKAKIYHNNVYQNALIKFINLGYNERDLELTLKYLKNCDVIIHFDASAEWFLNESKLKNVYEISAHNEKNTSLKERTMWENNLFKKIYGEQLNETDHLRVKYGCINLLADKCGCKSASGYGKSYIVLKKSLKNRISFVCGDSACMQQHICTFDYCVQLLLYLNESVLKNVIFLANDSTNNINNQNEMMNKNYNYIEVQIHGDVIFSRDVEKICLDSRHVNDSVIDRLNRDNINYEIFDGYKDMAIGIGALLF